MNKLTPILRPPANNNTGYYRLALPGIIDISYPSSALRRARVQEGGGRSAEQSPAAVSIASFGSKMKNRYILGRSNERGGGGHCSTLSFHANPYFGCVTSSRFSNREQLICEIKDEPTGID
ncbi:MAG: hypothetical protein NC311_07540 [Muribaculaceae bacterium]|nr:hypothetical protein [Muribaculaceae bacterium]